MKNKGLTLIEVMIMIAITGILVAILAGEMEKYHTRQQNPEAQHVEPAQQKQPDPSEIRW